MKTVIVTGASGFVGKHFVRRLIQEEDVQIITLDRRPPEMPWPKNIVQKEIDVRNSSSLKDVIKTASGTVVFVHLAWSLEHRDNAYQAQEEQLSVHASLLEALKHIKIDYFIGMGSSQEYGCRHGLLSETMTPCQPLSAYGWAKYSAQLLTDTWSKLTGIDTLWLRPFTIYGPGQRGDMLIPYTIKQLSKGVEALVSTGEQKRDFVYVSDVVNALLAGVKQRPREHTVLNVGSGIPISVRKMLMAIGDFF